MPPPRAQLDEGSGLLLPWAVTMDRPSTSVSPQPLTLASLCLDLGPELLDVLIAPRGLDVSLGGVVLHDPRDPPGTGCAAGDVVLGIAAADDESTLALIHAMGRAEAAAIICKRRAEQASRLIAASQEAGVAMLSTDPDVQWGELYELVRASLRADVASDLPRSPATMTGDLLALADATAAVAGGPVTIEDTSHRVLAFSQDAHEIDPLRAATILNRRVPDEWRRKLPWAEVVKQLIEADGVQRVEVPNTEPRRAIAIRARDEILGAIWLAGSPETLSPRADDALREAAQIAALHLLRQRVFDNLERRVRGGMLRMLLRGEGLAEPMLARLGFPPDRPVVVVAVKTGDVAAPAGVHEERLVSLLVEHLRAYRWQAVATALDGLAYVLVAVHEGADREALGRTVADCLVRAGQTLGVSLRAGMADEVADGADIPTGRRRADQCLNLDTSGKPVVLFEDIHARALLADTQAFLAGRSPAITPALLRLLDHDREHGTEYVSTLRAYLDSLGDTAVAAARMHIHTNTLRYRLRRVAELSEADLEDPEVRLSLQLQLYTLNGATGG